MGVRGIALDDDDKVISMSILRHVDVTRGRARGLSQARQRRAARRRRRAKPVGRTPRTRPAWPYRTRRAALCRAVGGRAVRADDVGARLRQALVVLRIPDHRPRRQRHRRHGHLGQEGGKSTQARSAAWSPRSRSRKTDQIMLVTDGGKLIRSPGRRHPHRRPLDAGRDRVQHRRRREGGVGRAAERGRLSGEGRRSDRR